MPHQPHGTNPTLGTPISPDGRPDPGRLYTVPARQGRAVRLERGQHLTIVNTHGTQVCDAWAIVAGDRDEVLSMPHLHGALSRITLRVGDPLVSNQRRPLLTLTEDTSPGIHDTVVAACDIYRYRSLGVEGYHDNCSDNLRMAMMAIGEAPIAVPAPLNIWMNTPVGADGAISWLPPVSHAGDRVVLRAEVDVIVVLSACPQDLVPINGADNLPRELHFQVD